MSDPRRVRESIGRHGASVKLVLGVEELDEGAGVALTPVVDGAMPDPGHGLLLQPCLYVVCHRYFGP